MDLYKTRKGNLRGAVVCGTSDITLDKSISTIIESQYPIRFTDPIPVSGRRATLGTFENPSIGYLKVFWEPGYNNYMVIGESYGGGAIPVVVDYAKKIDLKTKRAKAAEEMLDLLEKHIGTQLELLTDIGGTELMYRFLIKGEEKNFRILARQLADLLNLLGFH